MSTFRRATLRAASASLAVASVFLLATCDLGTILKPDDPKTGGSTVDSTELSLAITGATTVAGATTIPLGGAATLSVTSSSVSLTNVVKRFYSATPAMIAIDSTTGVMTGLAIGTAKVTAKILAPELGEGVTKSQSVRVRYKGIKITSPVVTDSIQGLGVAQQRTATVFGFNNSSANVLAVAADSLKSRDTTVFRIAGTTISGRKNGTAQLVAFFDGLLDSVAVRVRQVAKTVTFPTTDYTARHVNFNLTVPVVLTDVTDSLIPTAALVTWTTKDTTKAVIGLTTGILKMKSATTDSVFATMDGIKRGQKIVVSQVAGSLTKFQGDARSDTVAKNVTVVPTVTVLDSGLTPIVGTTVKFKVGSGLNAVVVDTLPVTTDVNGRAKPTSWKLGDVAGTNNNTLTATSGAQSTTFAVSAVPGVAKKLAFVVNPTSATVGVALAPAITVQVQDSLGNIISTGAAATSTVTLAISNNPGAATLAGTLTVAAVAGVATFSNISLNTGGSGYSLQASSGSLTAAISNGFDIFGTATKVAFTTQPAGTSAGATMSTVRVAIQDASGTTVSNSTASVTLAFSANPGTATLGGTVTVAAVAGIATFTTLTVNNAGVGYTLQATSPSLAAAVSNAFTVTAVGAANKLAFSVQPSNVVASTAVAPSIKVQVLDANGALVTTSTQQITLTIESTSPTGATLSGTPTRSASAGVATFDDISLNRTGTAYKLLATATGTALSTATSAAFNVTPGSVTKLGFVQQPTHTVAAATMAPAVTVEQQDAGGNRVAGPVSSVTLAIAAGTCVGATLSGGGAQNTSSGVATFGGISIATAVNSCNLTATSTGLTSATSSAFNSVASSGAARLSFTTEPSSSTTAGVALGTAPVVTIQDASGANVTAPSAVSVLLSVLSGPQVGFSSGGGTQNITTTATYSNITLNTAGAYRLLASATGFRPDTSALITVNPAAVNRVGLVQQPSNTIAGVPFSPAVQVAVQDQFGNTVPGATNIIEFSYYHFGGSSVPLYLNTGSFQATTTAVNGIATFTGLAPRTAGTTMYLVPRSTGLNEGQSAFFNVTAAPLAKLGFDVQPPNTATVATAMSPAIQVTGQDSVGNAITDFSNAVTVAVTGGPSGATLSGTKTAAAAAGTASFSTLALDRVGTGYKLNASASGVTTATSNAFSTEPIWITTCCPSYNDHVVVGSTLYFIGGNALKSVPTAGGTVTTIAGSTGAFKIATDGTNVFWAEQGTNNSGDAFVKKLTVSTTVVTTLTVAQTSLMNDWTLKMYADGSNVYFAARNAASTGMTIKSVGVNATSATPTELYASTNFGTPNFLWSPNGGLIYFFDPATSTIRRMTTTGASLTTLSLGTVSAQRFALDGTTLYFNDGVVIKSIASANTAGSAVTPTAAATTPGSVFEMAADGGNLYVNADGTLRRYSTANFATFADLLSSNPAASNWFYPITFDANYLTVITNFGRIGKVPK